ncbi:uncharacterized protein ACR2FA_008801 [Aphomia sociella]
MVTFHLILSGKVVQMHKQLVRQCIALVIFTLLANKMLLNALFERPYVVLKVQQERSDSLSMTSLIYYVIQMPENDPPMKLHKKPFRVYWNVPTMQCKSKKIPFENLYDKFGIQQNKNDSFRGEKIAILYDPGLFPALLKNETSGKFKFRNGGVPQEGDLQKHLATFRSVMEQSIPDPEFSGVGIIDFESWRPVFRQNFGVLVPYKDVSYEIERKLHWWWPKSWIQAEAKQRFEVAARSFMKSTLSLAKKMRPNALWGYYGFPYCFNMANNNHAERCANKVPEENDSTYWLWSESTALYPSVYSSKELSSSELAGLIRGRVREAARVKRNGIPILPYFWFRYRDGSYLEEEDLRIALQTLYKSNASGFIIWGSSNDVNTVEKCHKLRNYIENVMGPAIAKYTKDDSKIDNNVLSDLNNEIISNNNNTNWTTTTTMNPILTHDQNIVVSNINTVTPDPEFHWDPPENYTQDLAQYVKEELLKNSKYNNSTKEELNDTEINAINMIINTLINDKYNRQNYTETDNTIFSNNNENRNVTVFTEEVTSSTLSYSTTDTPSEYDDETTTVIVDLSTIVNLGRLSNNYKKGIPASYTEQTTVTVETDSTTITESSYTSTEINTNTYDSTTENNIDYNEFLYNDTSVEDFYDEFNTTITEPTTQSLLVEILTSAYNEDIISKPEENELPTEIIITTTTDEYTSATDTSTKASEDMKTTLSVSVKNIKKQLTESTITEYNDLNTTDTFPFGASTAFVEQVVV